MLFRIERRLLSALLALAALTSFGLLTASAEAKKGKPVSVFPAPKTPVASDETTFSFRGLNPKNLGKVKVVGSKTGQVGHTRLNHSDGKGVSIVPKRSFALGERVNVFTKKRIKLTNKGDFWVKIGNFYGRDDADPGPGDPLPKDGLKSRPELKPPAVDVTVNKPGASRGMVFFAPKNDGASIIDKAGRHRWYRPAGFGTKGSQYYNFQPHTYKGRPVLTYWLGASGLRGFAQAGAYEMLNNKYNRIARITPGNGYGANIHEFSITGRNTALVQSYQGVRYDLTPVGGPKDGKILDNVVQEIDIKTGAVLFEWHAIGNVALKASKAGPPADESRWDFLHINASKADGKGILISGRRTSTIYRVNRKTAKTMWRLRGDGIKPKTSDFNVAADAMWGYQHDMERLPNGNISLFDNGVHPQRAENQVPLVPINEESSVLVLKLSGQGENRKATLVNRYTHPNEISSLTQGSGRLLEGGNWFAGWGSEKQMSEFAENGELVWDATFNDADRESYRAFKAPWVGKPKDRPAIASEADGAGAKVYASWNGSTRVQKWKVLTGPDAGNLTEVGSSAWKGLETMISVPTVDTNVRVVAYDGKDRKIGQSGLIPLGEQSR